MKVQIVPALLETDISSAEDKIKQLKPGQLIHVDVVDNSYATNSFTAPLDQVLNLLVNLNVEVHLMTKEPNRYLETFTHNVRSCIIHQDIFLTNHEQMNFLNLLKSKNIEAIITTTPKKKLEPVADVNQYQVMGVMPGYSGQTMRADTVMRVVKLRQADSLNDMMISVDGGVNLHNTQSLIEAGANKLIMNSALWRMPEPQRFISDFK